jgi:erythronate-4-phosphate dehydrogenase
MKLVVDENIPQGKEAFGKFGEIILSGGRNITNEMLRDADVLIVRSITQVNESLLKNTNINFVGTATIGTDHVDKIYLEKSGIQFSDAAGCNAYSVAEYVLCAINQYLLANNKSYEELSIGIIGHGNVGSKVARFAETLGMKVIINDPPLERLTSDKKFRSLDEALAADVVTFHVPLNKTGIDKTVHLLNEENINKIKSGALLINSSRGPVVKNTALLNRLKEKNDLFTVLDVWEGEPKLNNELLNRVNIGTPHIAGYSYEGKINGTTIIHNKLSEFLNIGTDWKPQYPQITQSEFEFDESNKFEIEFDKLTKKIYDINSDSDKLKSSLSLETEQQPKYFDELRKKYHIRREFNNYSIRLSSANKKLKELLENLRFKVL